MKQKPLGRPEFSDSVNWFTLATQDDIEIDDDIYSLLQALNESDNKIELLMKINKIGKTKANTIINYLL
jgi:hypothetical protein